MTNDVTVLEPQLEGQQSALVRELGYWTVITNQAELESAIELCKEGRGLVKNITAFFAPMKEAAHKAHKEVCNRETEAIGKVETELKRVQKLADTFLTSERARLQEIERVRLQKERAEAEAQRRADEEAALKRAEELEAMGRSDLAAKVVETAAAVAETPLPEPEPVKVELPKTAGLTQRTVWDFEVVDFAAVPDQYKLINEAVVKAMIKTNEIPGIRRFQRQATSLRVRCNG